MSIRAVALLLITILLFASCEKNSVSNIPQISLIAFVPDSMRANIDTAAIEFGIIDGDADIGNDTASGIFLKDSRFESLGFLYTPFPYINISSEDPKKGLNGVCLFFPVPVPVPRPDSLHKTTGDTLVYEFYVTDRAGHQSNHIVTHPLIIRP